MGLTFTGPYGVYHSMYDDFFWMNHFGDPGYRYHTLMAQLWGVLALRLANAEMLPYDFDSYGENIRQFVVDLNLASHVSGHIDLAALQQHVTDFQAGGRELNLAVGAGDFFAGGWTPAAAAQVNQQLMQVERNWCNPQGIPGRPWFKHSLYAARYTYAHLELPGLTEAVRGRRLESRGGAGENFAGRAREKYELLKQTRALFERPAAAAQ